MIEHCTKCEATIQKYCMVCYKAICIKCDTYSKHNGHKYFIYCNDCIKFQCIKCKGILEKCIRCDDLFCVLCDDGNVTYDYDGYIKYCKKHRKLNVKDLYEYMKKTYNETLNLTELRNKIINS